MNTNVINTFLLSNMFVISHQVHIRACSIQTVESSRNFLSLFLFVLDRLLIKSDMVYTNTLFKISIFYFIMLLQEVKRFGITNSLLEI